MITYINLYTFMFRYVYNDLKLKVVLEGDSLKKELVFHYIYTGETNYIGCFTSDDCCIVQSLITLMNSGRGRTVSNIHVLIHGVASQV